MANAASKRELSNRWKFCCTKRYCETAWRIADLRTVLRPVLAFVNVVGPWMTTEILECEQLPH